MTYLLSPKLRDLQSQHNIPKKQPSGHGLCYLVCVLILPKILGKSPSLLQRAARHAPRSHRSLVWNLQLWDELLPSMLEVIILSKLAVMMLIGQLPAREKTPLRRDVGGEGPTFRGKPAQLDLTRHNHTNPTACISLEGHVYKVDEICSRAIYGLL